MTSPRAATQTTSLGRYHVVKRLAAGGMADVLLARTSGIEGFERHIVIKRIHRDLLEESRYLRMFLDEARLAASLHHHNIVQVNDIGEEDGEYFFAMEYVHGEDARTLLMETSRKGELIPIEHVVTIVTAAAAGLHHAHDQLGPDRTPLNIVHRDVSPANILIGYDGGVKVADFGIAQAAHRAEQTQSGVLKGKVAYMSPEQCNCDPIDRRSDVFSLGIVLYELVTVRPCFHGDNDFMTMSMIVGGKLERPSTFNPALPPELEAIILKALAMKPADRYATADELRIALEQFADQAGLRTSTTALADFMKSQFGTRPEPWLEDVSDEPEIEVIAPPVEDDLAVPQATGEPDGDIKLAANLRALAEPIKHARSLKPTVNQRGPELTERVRVPEPAPKRSRQRLWLAGAVAAVVIAAGALLLVSRDDAPTTKAPKASVRPHVERMSRPTVAREAIEPMAAPAPGPAKKAVKKRKAVDKPPKWDPDQLFPK